MSKKDKVEEEVVEESAARLAFRQLMERYKKQNPRKFESKKAELERKLSLIP